MLNMYKDLGSRQAQQEFKQEWFQLGWKELQKKRALSITHNEQGGKRGRFLTYDQLKGELKSDNTTKHYAEACKKKTGHYINFDDLTGEAMFLYKETFQEELDEKRFTVVEEGCPCNAYISDSLRFVITSGQHGCLGRSCQQQEAASSSAVPAPKPVPKAKGKAKAKSKASSQKDISPKQLLCSAA
eukprot:3290483-Amphidinium_carterae.1